MRKLMTATLLAGLTGFVMMGCDRDTSAFSTQDADRFRSLVSGRITDRQGKAVTGALVTALPGGTTTVSGDSGKFQLTLPSGSYRVSVIKDEYLDTTLSDSLRLPLLAKDTLARLGLVYRYATIKGVVLDSTSLVGQSGAGIVVQDQTVSATALPNGAFTLGKIEPGPVQVFAVVPGVGYASLNTTLHASDTLKNVSLAVSHKGGSVQGQVVTVGTGSARRLGSAARTSAASDSVGTPGIAVWAFGGVLRTTTASDGSFSLPTIPGLGPVAVTISNPSGSLTQTVTGVKVGEGRVLDLGNVWLNATSSQSDSAVRSSIALVHASDTSARLLAWTGNDTGLHVAKWKWDLGGSNDTTPVGQATMHRAEYMAQWKPGNRFAVHVWALFLDSAHKTLKASAPGTITVEVLPDPDTIAPVLVHLRPAADTIRAWADSVVNVSWTVTDALLPDSLWLNGQPFSRPIDAGWPAETLSIGRNVVYLKVRNALGKVSQDSLVVTRRPYVIPWNPQYTYGSLSDKRDGQTYKTIVIGRQTWMAENLSYKADSSWCPGNSADSCATYGRLYSWAAAMDTSPLFNSTTFDATGSGGPFAGICPTGWHIPSQTEWNTLQTTINGSSLKSGEGWDKSGNSGDTWGFRGLPAGYRDTSTTFYSIGAYARFWSSSETTASQAGALSLTYGSVQSALAQFDKRYAQSVRCISN